MKIMHVSDTHGYFPELDGEFDLVVISGDFLPNKFVHVFCSRSKECYMYERKFQYEWVFQNAEKIKLWTKNKPIVFCMGNHDFFNPCRLLKDMGVYIVDATDQFHAVLGANFYGFPYVPILNGIWNNERSGQDMHDEIQKMQKRLIDLNKFGSIDVFIAHCPPYGILDRVGNENIGSVHLANLLTYSFPKLPKLFLCGHVHESNGLMEMDEMKISNAAIGNGQLGQRPRLLNINTNVQ